MLLLPLGAWLAARTLYRVSGQVRGSGPSRRSIVTLALAGARRTSPGHNAYQRMVLASWMAAGTIRWCAAGCSGKWRVMSSRSRRG